jgi:serine/threonine protein kinase
MASASPQSLKRGTLLCGGAYSIRALLGCGSFGAVYDAVDMRSGCGVALKTEALSAASPQLGIEWMALDRHLRYKEGIPRVIWFGPCEDAGVEVLVMQRLGASVDALRAAVAAAGGDASANIVAPLPLYVVQYIALQALERLQSCHEEWLAHRDLKPENLLFESGSVASVAETLLAPTAASDAAAAFAANTTPRAWPRVYLIDFGLCKMMREADGRHIAVTRGKSLAGTPRYASLAAHRGLEQSRRDDLESLLYVLLHLARGALPWQSEFMSAADAAAAAAEKGRRGDSGDSAADDADFSTIAAIKARLTPREMCAGLPAAFEITLEHARNLAFDAMPDYALLSRAWRRSTKLR